MNSAESTIVLTLDPPTQSRLVEQVRGVIKASPLVRPVAANGCEMGVRVTNAGTLGWKGDGAYFYTKTDTRGRPWPAMPDEWREIADRAVALGPRHDGRPTRWDSAIINWYDPGATLGYHVDNGEADRSRPIVTISLGYSAIWGVEVEVHGHDEQGRATITWVKSRATLQSGAVTVLAGPLRIAPHSIIQVLPPTLFDPPSPIVDKAGAVVPGRVSITIRQAGA